MFSTARCRLTDYLPFVSNMFLHGGWLHLIVNMWTLWLFGRAVEDQLGSGRYLAFYFACGILASITYAALNPNSTVPALGASGAIAGILGCYMRFFPFSRIVVLIPILFIPLFFEVPAMLFAGLWFLFQILGAVAMGHTVRRRRHSLVGPYRRLHRRRHSRGSCCGLHAAGTGRATSMKAFRVLRCRNCLRQTMTTRRIS